MVLGFAGLDLMGDTLAWTRGSRPNGGACRFACTGADASCRSRIAGGVLQATLAAGEAMELRVAGNAHQLAPGATLEVPL